MRAWGSNTYGQLGDGTTTNRLTPVKVSTFQPGRFTGAGLEDLAQGASRPRSARRRLEPSPVRHTGMPAGNILLTHSLRPGVGLATVPRPYGMPHG